MKALLTLVLAFVLTSSAQAGLLGWLTSSARDWQFVQRTGGMRIGPLIEQDGKRLLPVEYDVTGLSTITCKPTTINSGIVVRKIEASKKGDGIILRVFTQVVETSSARGSQHHADLSWIPPGSYDVFYETPGAPEKRLGHIEIKPRGSSSFR